MTTTQKAKKTDGFSAEERAAMKERAKELKAQARGADGEAAVREAIAEMPQPDRDLATRFHELVHEVAPALVPRTWYGMPAYAKDGKVVVFFKSGPKYKERYATVGFNDPAQLDEGSMWPTSFALTDWNVQNERRLRKLLTQSLG